MTTKALCIFLPLFSLLLAAAANAEDDPELERAKVAIDQFRKQYASEESEARILAIVALDQVQHELVVAELGKKPIRDRDPEVRDVAAQVLGRMKGHAEQAGKILKTHLLKNKEYPEVQLSIVRSIGKLGYLDARKDLQKYVIRYFRDEKYRWVINEVIRTFGVLKDVESLPILLRLWEYRGKTKRGEAGEEIYSEQGSAAARREYEQRHGKKADPEGGPDSFERTWLQQLRKTVKVLTGQDFSEPLEFRLWLKKNRDRLAAESSRRERD